MGTAPLTDHPAERKAAPRELADSQRIRQPQRVAPEHLDAVVAARNRSAAVTSNVIAQDTEVGRHSRSLQVPLRVIAPQRMRKEQHRPFIRTVEPVILAKSTSLNQGHESLQNRAAAVRERGPI